MCREKKYLITGSTLEFLKLKSIPEKDEEEEILHDLESEPEIEDANQPLVKPVYQEPKINLPKNTE